jgi:hypothetical protein
MPGVGALCLRLPVSWLSAGYRRWTKDYSTEAGGPNAKSRREDGHGFSGALFSQDDL